MHSSWDYCLDPEVPRLTGNPTAAVITAESQIVFIAMTQLAQMVALAFMLSRNRLCTHLFCQRAVQKLAHYRFPRCHHATADTNAICSHWGQNRVEQHKDMPQPLQLIMPVYTTHDVVLKAFVGVLGGKIKLSLCDVEPILVLANSIRVSHASFLLRPPTQHHTITI